MVITTHQDHELAREQVAEILKLMNGIWDPPDISLEEQIENFFAHQKTTPDWYLARRYIAWDGEKPLAHALTFSRKIYIGEKPLTVLALAGVCSSPEVRGQGLGKTIVECAFSRIHSGEFEVSLFQTDVAEFYNKLGGRVITNKFCNRKNTEDPDAWPWWGEEIMIYPATFPWPEEKIDLNGRGY